eukprot:4340495-Amphidinium_carterae.1
MTPKAQTKHNATKEHENRGSPLTVNPLASQDRVSNGSIRMPPTKKGQSTKHTHTHKNRSRTVKGRGTRPSLQQQPKEPVQ